MDFCPTSHLYVEHPPPPTPNTPPPSVLQGVKWREGKKSKIKKIHINVTNVSLVYCDSKERDVSVQ